MRSETEGGRRHLLSFPLPPQSWPPLVVQPHPLVHLPLHLDQLCPLHLQLLLPCSRVLLESGDLPDSLAPDQGTYTARKILTKGRKGGGRVEGWGGEGGMEGRRLYEVMYCTTNPAKLPAKNPAHSQSCQASPLCLFGY